jgi:hypothetical protein
VQVQKSSELIAQRGSFLFDPMFLELLSANDKGTSGRRVNHMFYEHVRVFQGFLKDRDTALQLTFRRDPSIECIRQNGIV